MTKRIWFEGDKNINAGWMYVVVDENENSNETYGEFDIRFFKAVANWMIGPISEHLNKNGYSWDMAEKIFDKTKIYDLVGLVEFTDLIDFSTAKGKIFPLLVNNFTEERVWDIMVKLNMFDKADGDEIKKIIDDVLIKHSDKVIDYKKGKVGLLSLFIGEAMKIGKGRANPKEITELLKEKLKN